MKKALIAGPCISEFGWELMAWQGHVRYLARDADRIIVCSTPGFEPLYADYCDRFIGHQVTGVRDCHKMKKMETVMNHLIAENNLDDIEEDCRTEGFEVVRVCPTGWNLYRDEQCFIKFGIAAQANEAGRKYDVVVHARNRTNKTEFTGSNYPNHLWTDVVSALTRKSLRVCCVGTVEQAFGIPGATDLRGIPLDELMDVMAAAGVVIGPSSGPMHLASLCCAPHVTWSHTRISPSIGCSNRERYERVWNPLETPVKFIPNRQPSVAAVVAATLNMLYGQDKEKK